MRILLLLFLLLLGTPMQAGASGFPESIREMIHVTVRGTNVRLRAGAGTEFKIQGLANSDSPTACRYVAFSQPRMDSKDIPWFMLIGRIEGQDKAVIVKLEEPCWIRSDLVTVRALRYDEALNADSIFFRILHVCLDNMSGVASFIPAAEVPVCSREEDCLSAANAPVTDAALPAGKAYHLWATPQKGDTGEVCIPIWEKLSDTRIRLAGTMPRTVFDSFDFGPESKEAVERWKARQPAELWQQSPSPGL